MKNFIYFAVIFLVACSKPAAEIETEQETTPTVVVDSVKVTLTLENAGWAGNVSHTDIFIYDASGLMALESHIRLDSLPHKVNIRTTKGIKNYVAICNCPYAFNLQALDRYESMELLSFNFTEDNPEEPLISGSAKGGKTAIQLTPMMCRIILDEISNGMDGYELLEEPRIFLTGANPCSEILRTKEYRPKEELEDTTKTPLPYDIGFYTQHPGTTLYCYPNDTPDNILGCPKTTFNLECRIKGKKHLFKKQLPPMGRGSTIKVKITVNSPDEYYFETN